MHVRICICSPGMTNRPKWVFNSHCFDCAFYSWRSCKQKKALSKARAAELGTSPEGEKLQSDSGVFLDSYSLQDNQPSKGMIADFKGLRKYC